MLTSPLPRNSCLTSTTTASADIAFEQARHVFRAGVTFEHVCAAYEFDRILRDLLTEALEVVEIDFRTAVAYHFAHAHGPFGHTASASFFGQFHHADWMARLRDEAQRSSELFIIHFRSRYSQFPDLPVWAATEVMSFGALSQMFKGMLRSDQKAVAQCYRVQPTHLATWIHHLVYVRNVCAHHGRLWDRVWSIKPSLPAGAAWRPPHLPSNQHLSVTLLILNRLMGCRPCLAPFAADWRRRVMAHLDHPPQVSDPLSPMGLAPDWRNHPLWR